MRLFSIDTHTGSFLFPAFGAKFRGYVGTSKVGRLEIATCKVPNVQPRFPLLRLSISDTSCRRYKKLSTALRAVNAAEQTQTVTQKPSTISIAPILGKAPRLDDSGTGLPPRDDGGGGGGGGGGHNFSGGFFFFAFLVFLNYLKELEDEEDSRRGDLLL